MGKKNLTQQQDEKASIIGSSADNAVPTVSVSKKWEAPKDYKNKDTGVRLITK